MPEILRKLYLALPYKLIDIIENKQKAIMILSVLDFVLIRVYHLYFLHEVLVVFKVHYEDAILVLVPRPPGRVGCAR